MSAEPARTVTIADVEISAVTGDITELDVEAIVNAANTHLQHGGGVAAAIASAGGPVIQSESNDWVDEHGPLESGQAAVTSGGDLPAGSVIHVAGPVYDGSRGDNEEKLRAAVDAAMRAAVRIGVTSVALPAISAGIYGYPLDDATRIAADQVGRSLRQDAGSLRRVVLVGFKDDVTDAFADGLQLLAE